MDPNTLFLIIIAVLLICFFAGRRAGLIRALIPLVSAFLSFWLMTVAFPIFKEDVMGDVTGFAFNDAVVDVVAFGVTFLLIRWLIKTVLRLLRIVGDAPVIGTVNRLLGGVFGFVGGLVLIWGTFFFLLLIYDPAELPGFFEAVNGNPFVKLLYNNNLVMTFVNYFVFAY